MERSDLLKARLATLESAQEAAGIPERLKSIPEGWRPGAEWKGTSGTLTTGPVEGVPDWSAILEERGLDPQLYEVDGSTIRWSSWDGWRKDPETGEVESALCTSYKADIRLRAPQAVVGFEDLYKETAKLKLKAGPSGDACLVVCLSDWQVGNRDFQGVEAQVRAIAEIPEIVRQRVADLRRQRISVGTVLVAGLGDLGEGCTGFYPAQPYRVELDYREQGKIVRRGVRDIIIAAARAVEQVFVTTVPSNHGERRDGKRAFTTVGDNDDITVFEQVAEILSVNEEFAGIQWKIPVDEVATGLRIAGQNLAFTHGHVPKFRQEAAKTLWEWWKDQAHGRAYPEVADADILTAGHFHHFCAKEQEGRALFICPSLTQVSEYFADRTGVKTRCGTLTYVVTPDGWGELSILA